MLELVNITKDYEVASGAVHALKGISLKFRKSEFVSILGPSGCGKTTLLNIIGGLDHYTSGDLIINGKSTKEYNDRDWDTYRNHSIGFIFQSYHLIPHQTVLQNVELALMISGVSKRERRRRAIEALDKVGLKDRMHNRPNQLSGGQAQRVAIARALINDPEIVLADEPTGALDSKTSVQIMELLKEISRDRLVIMVTHNPDLAKRYSTRIINLLDGAVIGDSRPFTMGPAPQKELTKKELRELKKKKGNRKRSAMPFTMSFSLSLKNLLSKRRRTAMVSVAGSIGIIGVSMVLAISSGVQDYIDSMQDDMLSGNPVSITETAIDYTSLLGMSSSAQPDVDITKLGDKVYINSLMETLGTFAQGFSTTNNISSAYLNYVENVPAEYYNVIQYDYGFDVANNIYTDFKVDANATTAADKVTSVTAIRGMYTQILREQEDYADFAGTISTVATFEELPDNYQYILSQYDIVAAYTDENGIVKDASELTEEQIESIFNDKSTLIMVTSDDTIPDLMMGQFGYLTQKEFLNYAFEAVGSDMYDEEVGLVGSGQGDDEGFDYSKFLGPDAKTFTWYSNDDIYYNHNGTYYYKPYEEGNFGLESRTVGGEERYVPFLMPDIDTSSESAVDLSVKLILQKKEAISYGCLSTGFYHTKALTDYARNNSLQSRIVSEINASEEGYLSMLPYFFNYVNFSDANGDGVIDSADYEVNAGQAGSAIYDSGSIMDMLLSGLGGGGADQSTMLRVDAALLGGAEMPVGLYIYPIDFDSKTAITDYLDEWNNLCENGAVYTWTDADGTQQSVTLGEIDKVTYTDTVGLIINMVNTMIQMITIALIAFTALSLVVSTVMIGIITYVSVVERIKEIGILRAVGARKKDIKRLFNAETFIIGLVAGLIGIAITYILSFIINIIVLFVAGIWGIASLPWWQALIMIGLSIVLTLISGLIPASAAARKDPVVALRTE
ncbi:MAG TPA: ATP-binding cassette domain-containing protein [Candidatus Coproplasma excrementipullorum]|nr:ATP-binding cassette domain-containing protein [Candidatus Coproplasma excrementipullorum]